MKAYIHKKVFNDYIFTIEHYVLQCAIFFDCCSILLQKTNSCNKIQLSTKLIIQHYSKTKYKMHELTQNEYGNVSNNDINIQN